MLKTQGSHILQKFKTKIIKVVLGIFFGFVLYHLFLVPYGDFYEKNIEGQVVYSKTRGGCGQDVIFSPNKEYVLALCEFGWDYHFLMEVYKVSTGRLVFRDSFTFTFGGHTVDEIITITNDQITVITDDDDSEGNNIVVTTSLPPSLYQQFKAFLVSLLPLRKLLNSDK